ncbi:PREDICTED: KH domain-containing protein C56G2.1-like isoform X2 [Ceratosolen solmsi marchali]|uniref:KH domain-containing protein C56G2.1-like isoform X2 n=1 Tax=Ceratosolen solmsi marchali TaxID=326594 RepID=A0AAJ7DWX1_9HYME|nr:PREDICTED: KH domain-containing protein C56G2.1-like isoform X2 [Ceratosolen solmsi marchali]XP_011499409.1 PREDICTED: KH domain-containing protein C56G2.1-like isoform X2 [Ceratosolen solmsi marchali]
MSFCQVRLVKWSFPVCALILGLLWYKRRRVDRVDPGGSSKSNGDTSLSNGSSLKAAQNGNLCDSGIQTDDSFSFNTTTASTPVEEIISPRKVSESLDIPNRKSNSQSLSLLSCKSIEFSNTPWYDDVENTPEMKEIQLVSNPTNSGLDFMTKNKPDELKNSKNSSIIENMIEEEAKIVVAKSEVTEQMNISQSEFKNCKKSVTADDQQSSGDEKKQRQVLSERDSANHSPVSGVLEGSVTDEARSEGSTDSGKGGSIKGHPKDNNRTIYEFLVSIKLVGKLIGRGGQFFQHIRNNADVGIVVKRHPSERDYKICSIDGTPENIATALDMIRQLFPEKTTPFLSLEQIAYEILPEEIPWVSELMQLSLIEGVNNDVIVSHIYKPNHLFIQLPTHPTYPSLRILDDKMTELYETVESPPVPDELRKGMIVVAKWYNKWVRVYIETPDPKGEQSLVRLVDHGGYWIFSNSNMRKIRSDYLSLPFQAIEVFLANVRPKDEEWSQEAYNVVGQICSRIVGQAQIVGYVDCSTFINLYFNIHKHGVISIADELIARGIAESISLDEVFPQEILPSV